MARKVMQRVIEMIKEQKQIDPAILKRVLEIEQAYHAQNSNGAVAEIDAVIAKAAKNPGPIS